jgi:hypothetical protein
VRKKLKRPSFAAAVDCDDITAPPSWVSSSIS